MHLQSAAVSSVFIHLGVRMQGHGRNVLMRHPLVRLLLAALLVLLSHQAWAQTRGDPAAISIVVPYPAGGSADVFARIIAPTLGTMMGRTVIVENISGATGSIGAMKVLSGPPDGNLMFLGSPTDAVLAPLAMNSVKYEASDFQLVGLLTTAPLALYARGDLPANTVDELVTQARQSPGKPLSYGSTGHGSLYHIVASNMITAAGLTATHIPYRGGMPMLQDLMGGTVDFAVLPVDGTLAKLVETGRIKVLAVMADQRATRFAYVPTLAESQVLKRFATHSVWAGLLVPRNTPLALAQSLHKAVHETMQSPAVRSAMEAAGGALPTAMTLNEAASFYAAESASLRTLARAAGIQPN